MHVCVGKCVRVLSQPISHAQWKVAHFSWNTEYHRILRRWHTDSALNSDKIKKKKTIFICGFPLKWPSSASFAPDCPLQHGCLFPSATTKWTMTMPILHWMPSSRSRIMLLVGVYSCPLSRDDRQPEDKSYKICFMIMIMVRVYVTHLFNHFTRKSGKEGK